MRIAYLSSACIPSRTANSVHVMKMCQALACAGHEVVLIAPDKAEEREAAKGDPFDYYGVASNFVIEYLPWARMRGRGYRYGWRAARRVRRAKFDLALGRNPAACFFAAHLGVPVIYEAHSPVEDDGRLAKYLFGRLIRSPSFMHLVVITEALRRHFEHAWPNLKGRIVVAPDGADPIRGDVEPVDFGCSVDRMQVGYAGHLYAGKGAELVIDLARACPQFDFHLVGGTETSISYWRQRIDLPRNLWIHGYKPHGSMPQYLLALDVALLPNQPAVRTYGGTRDIGQWTSPLKLFEYMAAGRAIVCSDVPVLQEVSKHEVNALVCRHDNITDWADALHRLFASPALRASLGNTARNQLVRMYTWDVRANRVLNSTWPSASAHFSNSES